MGFHVALMPAKGYLSVGLRDVRVRGRGRGSHGGEWRVGEGDFAMRRARGWKVGALGRGVIRASGGAGVWEGGRGGVGAESVEWKERDGGAWRRTEDGSEFHHWSG